MTFERNLPQGCGNGWAASTEIREGKVGCLFDEIGKFVEPTERLHMDVQAGCSEAVCRSVADRGHASGPPSSSEH
jgi:hypothetical protein